MARDGAVSFVAWPPSARYAGGVRIRPRVVAALTAAAGIAAIVFVAPSRLHSPPLGPLRVTPEASRVSVRVGEKVRFSAAADKATGFTWSIWGRRVSSEAAWWFVPRPEHAGWQQVTLEARGPGGTHVARAWDVGVVAPVAPELEELTPPAGRISLPRGETASFRCTARLPAGRPSDRLSFEWTLDGRIVLFEQYPAGDAASELFLPAEVGSHRLRVSVTEDGRTASLADWTLDVAPAEPEPLQEAAVPPTPAPAGPTPPRALEARFVPAPGPRRQEAAVGEALAFEARVEPDSAAASFRWTVDGRPSRRNRTGQLAYEPTKPGRHRIAVTAEADGRVVGHDAWVVVVRGPDALPTIAERELPPRAEPEPPAPAPPPSLAEVDVRRWLEEYARAWSRKDVGALRRMGQIRSATEAAGLERYFGSIGELEVDVRVLDLRLDGDRASVEFERVDTVTDPAGRRQQLRLPPIRKEIERTPDGLRFADQDTRG